MKFLHVIFEHILKDVVMALRMDFIFNLFFRVFVFGFLLFLASCKSDPYLYDRPGFDQGTMLDDQNNKSGYVKVVPDYYYRQPSYQGQGQQQYYTPQGYPQNYQQQGYYNQYPAQQPPFYYPSQIEPGGGSRFYSNPYAIPPSSYYPYYDGDQYYVPPTSHNGIEGQQPEGVNKKVDIR